MRSRKKEESGDKNLLGATVPKLARGRVLKEIIASTPPPSLPSSVLPFSFLSLPSSSYLSPLLSQIGCPPYANTVLLSESKTGDERGRPDREQ